MLKCARHLSQNVSNRQNVRSCQHPNVVRNSHFVYSVQIWHSPPNSLDALNVVPSHYMLIPANTLMLAHRQ